MTSTTCAAFKGIPSKEKTVPSPGSPAKIGAVLGLILQKQVAVFFLVADIRQCDGI